MKKLMLLSLALVFVASAAMAQPTMYTAVEIGGVQYTGNVSITATGLPFDVVTVVENIPGDFFAYEFTTDQIPLNGVMFITGEVLFGAAPLDLGDVPGEHIVGNGSCDAVSSAVLLRTSYFPFAGVPGPDTVINLGGTDPSSFAGAPGIAACDGTIIPAVPGTEGGVTGSGASFSDGGLVINGTPAVIATEPASFGEVKARF